MRIRQLATKPNLRLAWDRITTGGNLQYKELYRPLYVAYGIALDKNLKDLRERLIGSAFEARRPERIYLPKASGLHRPISLLHIEDQIVLQAFANLAAKKLHAKRKPLQFTTVFSNIFVDHTSKFLFKRWQETYAAFQNRIRTHYSNGLRWVGDFDLAAFYDTISHELLFKTIYPKTSLNDDMRWLQDCLRTWSSMGTSSGHGHGIPQGPIASDLLAECFLLPIDLELRKRPGYTRYVDDVRLFGTSEHEVQVTVIELERRCVERGLIPQSGKFQIKRATSLRDAIGMLPSLADPHEPGGEKRPSLPAAEARNLFMAALRGRPYKVHDKSRLRYVLFRAEPDSRLLDLVMRLIPRHPEHTEAFFHYLQSFPARKPITKLCCELIESSPYLYVRGQAWIRMAQNLTERRGPDAGTRYTLINQAIKLAKRKSPDRFAETLGACCFLAAAERVEPRRYSRFLKYQSPLIQAFAAPFLTRQALELGGVAHNYFRRRAFEPGLSICGRFHELDLDFSDLDIDESDLSLQVHNTLHELGTLPTSGTPVDPIAEILNRRYGVTQTKSWKTLLGSEYSHVLRLLKLAEAAFNAARSNWLASQNSFNHAIFLALQHRLNTANHPAACRMQARNGKPVDFGVMLDSNSQFSRNCRKVADCFRAINSRRHSLPAIHPYEKKTGRRARHLSPQERKQFVSDIRAALPDFIALMP